MNNQQAATRLLSDIRRVGGSSTLMPYQADAVRELIQEINTLYNGIERRSQEAPSSAGLSLVQRSILRRQRRCLVVYHSVRCDRVEGLRWTTGAVLPPGATRENLCSSEVDYFKAYSAAVSNYLDLCGLDLTAVSARGHPFFVCLCLSGEGIGDPCQPPKQTWPPHFYPSIPSHQHTTL